MGPGRRNNQAGGALRRGVLHRHLAFGKPGQLVHGTRLVEHDRLAREGWVIEHARAPTRLRQPGYPGPQTQTGYDEPAGLRRD